MQNAALMILPDSCKPGYAVRGSTSGEMGDMPPTRLRRRRSSGPDVASPTASAGVEGDLTGLSLLPGILLK